MMAYGSKVYGKPASPPTAAKENGPTPMPNGHSGTPALPAALTSTSQKPPRIPRRRRLPKITPSEVSQVLSMKAEGINDRAVGRALGINSATIGEIARKPENQAEITARRSWLKTRTSQRLENLIEPAWDMAQKAAEDGDAKSFDAAMRGLHAKEKISASVAGENQRMQVEHSGTVVQPPLVELKLILAQLFADDAIPKP